MSTSRIVARIAASATAGGVSAAVGGACIGYFYESLQDAPFVRIPFINEIGFGLCFGICGFVMGLVVGAAKLRKLSAIALGLLLGVILMTCWVSFVISVITRPDRVILTGTIPNMVLAGLLSAIVGATISDRFN